MENKETSPTLPWLLALLLFLASCTATTAIHKTGWYTVEASRGYQVKFVGYDRYITLPVDTLRPGHKVHMTKIDRYGKGE